MHIKHLSKNIRFYKHSYKTRVERIQKRGWDESQRLGKAFMEERRGLEEAEEKRKQTGLYTS